MSENNQDLVVDMGIPTTTPSIIKVIGVGGGGGNAVNHMYREGIHDVNFVLCNTDSKALSDSPVPFRLQLGKEGLGVAVRPRAQHQPFRLQRHIRFPSSVFLVVATAGVRLCRRAPASFLPVLFQRFLQRENMTFSLLNMRVNTQAPTPA